MNTTRKPHRLTPSLSFTPRAHQGALFHPPGTPPADLHPGTSRTGVQKPKGWYNAPPHADL